MRIAVDDTLVCRRESDGHIADAILVVGARRQRNGECEEPPHRDGDP